MEEAIPDSRSGGGPWKSDDTTGTPSAVEEETLEEAATLMKVGLGIGATAGFDHVTKQEKKKCCQSNSALFTAAQYRELQEQALIFRYLAAGLPVPPSLVFPIWESVATTLASTTPDLDFRQFTSFVGFSYRGLENRNFMELEPGRCRRTDGKKWRCSKDVVNGQKYCERHMHRGRNRSRKPVEASQNKTIHHDSSKNPDIARAIRAIVSPDLMTNNVSSTPSFSTDNVDTRTTGATATAAAKAVDGQMSTGMSMITKPISNGTTNTSLSMITSSVKMGSTYNSSSANRKRKSKSMSNNNNNMNSYVIHNLDSNGRSCYFGSTNLINRSSKSQGIKSFGSDKPQGYDFSPKSVLQVRGYRALPLFSVQSAHNSKLERSIIEPEPWRCKRTDGKKWRCRRHVVINEKYCEMHMHRGSKRIVEAREPTPPPPPILPNISDCAYLNTNLSISIHASPQCLNRNDDDASPMSSSDATISDNIVADDYEERNISC